MCLYLRSNKHVTGISVLIKHLQHCLKNKSILKSSILDIDVHYFAVLFFPVSVGELRHVLTCYRPL